MDGKQTTGHWVPDGYVWDDDHGRPCRLLPEAWQYVELPDDHDPASVTDLLGGHAPDCRSIAKCDEDQCDCKADPAPVTEGRTLGDVMRAGSARWKQVEAIYNPAPATAVIDAAHLEHQRDWSRRTFGPGTRLLGVLDHIRKELAEIEADPTDLTEWVDVIILAFDGAWRAGWEPQQTIDAIKTKQARNEARTWPDWRTLSADVAIEHDRLADPAPVTDGLPGEPLFSGITPRPDVSPMLPQDARDRVQRKVDESNAAQRRAGRDMRSAVVGQADPAPDTEGCGHVQHYSRIVGRWSYRMGRTASGLEERCPITEGDDS